MQHQQSILSYKKQHLLAQEAGALEMNTHSYDSVWPLSDCCVCICSRELCAVS